MRRYLFPEIGNVPVADITAPALLRALAQQAATGGPARDRALADRLKKSVRTVNNQLATLYRKKLGLSGDKWRLLQVFEQDLTQARYFLQYHILTV